MNLRACAVLAVVTLFSPNVAALEYQLPLEPIAPRDRAECHALYERFDEIVRALSHSAKAKGDEAWEIAKNGSTLRASPVYRQSQRLYDEAHSVRMKGWAARTRCFAQVHAYDRQQRQDRDQFRQTNRAVDSLPRKAGETVVNAAAKAGLDAYRQYGVSIERNGQVYRVPVTGAKGMVAGTLSRALSQASLVQAIFLPSDADPRHTNLRIGGLAAASAFSEIGLFNRLQSSMVKSILGAIIDIHTGAVGDLEAAVRQPAFDPSADRSIGIDIHAYARKVNDRLRYGSGGGTASKVDMSEYDTRLPDLARQSRSAVADMVADRGSRSEAAIQRPVAKPNAPRRQAPTRSSPGTRYSATQCSQLLAQIRHYRSILPSYRAAGQGGLIEMGIRENQNAYNRGCR